MSITVSTDVVCDECSDWFHGSIDTKANIRKARQRAKAAGWRFVDGSDTCDQCSKETQQ